MTANDAVRIALVALALILAVVTWRRSGPSEVRRAGGIAVDTMILVIPKLVLALFTASLLAEVLPAAAILSVVGPETGLMGIVLASILGGILPGGPVTAFPIALFVWQIGAGVPQVVALLTGWACFAFHRLLAYEIPMIGPRYAVLRMLSVAVVPVMAGLLASLVLGFLPPGSVAFESR